MCVNNQNVTQAEVDEIVQFLTQKEATPLKKLLAAIALQANSDGGICVAIANLPEGMAERGQQPVQGGGDAGPGIFPAAWSHPDQGLDGPPKGKPDDDGAGGMYL